MILIQLTIIGRVKLGFTLWVNKLVSGSLLVTGSLFMGREVVIALTEGKLDFCPWEQVFYDEFDGKRNKRVLVKIMGV